MIWPICWLASSAPAWAAQPSSLEESSAECQCAQDHPSAHPNASSRTAPASARGQHRGVPHTPFRQRAAGQAMACDLSV